MGLNFPGFTIYSFYIYDNFINTLYCNNYFIDVISQ